MTRLFLFASVLLISFSFSNIASARGRRIGRIHKQLSKDRLRYSGYTGSFYHSRTSKIPAKRASYKRESKDFSRLQGRTVTKNTKTNMRFNEARLKLIKTQFLTKLKKLHPNANYKLSDINVKIKREVMADVPYGYLSSKMTALSSLVFGVRAKTVKNHGTELRVSYFGTGDVLSRHGMPTANNGTYGFEVNRVKGYKRSKVGGSVLVDKENLSMAKDLHF